MYKRQTYYLIFQTTFGLRKKKKNFDNTLQKLKTEVSTITTQIFMELFVKKLEEKEFTILLTDFTNKYKRTQYNSIFAFFPILAIAI